VTTFKTPATDDIPPQDWTYRGISRASHFSAKRRIPSDVISQRELDEIALEYKRVARFDIDGLNDRPSLSVSVGPL